MGSRGRGGGGGGGDLSVSLSVMTKLREIYLSNISVEQALNEAIRHAEARIQSQQNLNQAADQRALATCGLVFVIVALSIDKLHQSSGSLSDILALGHLLLGSALAAFSAKPTRFYSVGGRASGFLPYLCDTYAGYTLSAIAERYDDYIDHNEKYIMRNARLFSLSLIFIGTGLLMMFLGVGVTVWSAE
jgi:hypothetical protein